MTDPFASVDEHGPSRRRVLAGAALGAGLLGTASAVAQGRPAPADPSAAPVDEVDLRFRPTVAGPGLGAPDREVPARPPVVQPGRRFADKVVLITGATSGIGRTTAFAFAREGARVAFCGRREALGREVEGQIRAEGGEATYVPADVMKAEDVERFVRQTLRRYGGRIDVAFNNAGYEGVPAPFEEQTVENFDTVMMTNARGVFLAGTNERASWYA